ncbi:hypothetical protein [Xylanibacter muris]|uniref:Thioredoxin domain-containing protein n=1 Tax=Xylanibacter muris TaxID=2736290 RepID=A0ABX2APV5_9BACT|nr:hypothetical protein [Xylanibacter muris]NPD92567.1 hypothetical protein [Xylanibacter muris]
MKKSVLLPLLAIVALAGHAKVWKRIKYPVAMACVNVYYGELQASEVILSDTATTVRFTMKYEKKKNFRFAKGSYLTDEDGRRYALRSAEGIALGKWVRSPESGITGFTMHFEPMPKHTKVFDFIEGDGSGAFMLLGIHDNKYKIKAPSMKQLSDANPYEIPQDWFKTDTVTVRGRIEGYDEKRFGFSSMEYFTDDVFRKDNGTVVMDIEPDGKFEKKFCVSYPVYSSFITRSSKVGLEEIPFFARPGETVDITVSRNGDGRYECRYNSGSSKDAERLLRSGLNTIDLCYPLIKRDPERKISDAMALAEDIWRNLLYHVKAKGRIHRFTPMEMQLALAGMQLNFAYSWMDYIMYHEDDVAKWKKVDGKYTKEITDSAEWLALGDAATYTPLKRIELDNPLLLTNSYYDTFVNRIQYSDFVRIRPFGGETGYVVNAVNCMEKPGHIMDAIREMTATEHNSLLAQICIYNDMLDNFNLWRNMEQRIPVIMADTTKTDAERKELVAGLALPGNVFPAYLNMFSNPYVREKAEKFYAGKMAQTELTAPLPEGSASADFVRSIAARYPGRFLFIDFWGMGCGPCRSAIQSSREMRRKIASRDDVKLVFIADERDANGSDAYRKYISEWLDGEEAICVSNTDFARLRELFQFNGIPHYETISPDCRRVRDDMRISGFYHFEQELDGLIKRLDRR